MNMKTKQLEFDQKKEKDPIFFYLVYFSSIMKKVLRLQFIY